MHASPFAPHPDPVAHLISVARAVAAALDAPPSAQQQHDLFHAHAALLDAVDGLPDA